MHSSVRAAESAYGLAMHVIAMWQYYNTVALQNHHVPISHDDTVTFTHVLRVLQFSAFLSHILPYAIP